MGEVGILLEEFLDYSYFETKIFQFKNRSGEIGTDWSLLEKKIRERSTTGWLCAGNSYVQLLPKFPVVFVDRSFKI